MKTSLPPWVPKFRLAILAGAVAFACGVFIAVRFPKVSELETAQETAEAEVRKMQRNIKNGENLESQLDRIEQMTDRLWEKTVIPEDASVNKAYFYQFETETLKIQSVEQRNPGGGGAERPWSLKNFDTVEFSITAQGSFADVLELAYRIRGGPKLVRVTSLSLLPEGAGYRRTIELTIEAIAEKSGEEEEDSDE